MLDTLHSPRFVDKAPAEAYATLLDEGVYLCSIATMYRILRANEEVRERRKQRKQGQFKKPELIAVRPNQVWSWDITKLRGPVKWHYYYLYVILDIFSRYVVGWLVAERETGCLAKQLIEECCARQGINQNELTIHSDRGSPMKSTTVAQLLATLGITKSFGRPSVSDDNPYSEAQFKTLKYNPWFPGNFGSLEDAKSHCREFLTWYNHDHHHSGLALLTPHQVHSGNAGVIQEQRHQVLQAAYTIHPERFVLGNPKPLELPHAAWINPPDDASMRQQLLELAACNKSNLPILSG